jgi:hypothetical protein
MGELSVIIVYDPGHASTGDLLEEYRALQTQYADLDANGHSVGKLFLVPSRVHAKVRSFMCRPTLAPATRRTPQGERATLCGLTADALVCLFLLQLFLFLTFINQNLLDTYVAAVDDWLNQRAGAAWAALSLVNVDVSARVANINFTVRSCGVLLVGNHTRGINHTLFDSMVCVSAEDAHLLARWVMYKVMCRPMGVAAVAAAMPAVTTLGHQVYVLGGGLPAACAVAEQVFAGALQWAAHPNRELFMSYTNGGLPNQQTLPLVNLVRLLPPYPTVRSPRKPLCSPRND